MKRLKKIVSVLLAMAMVLGMGLTAFADETEPTKYTITITNKPADDEGNHIYDAYQIFAGELEADPLYPNDPSKKVLTNITWGSGVESAALMDDLKTNMESQFGDIKTGTSDDLNRAAAEVAKILADPTKFVSNDADSKEEKLIDTFARIVANHTTGTPTGSSEENDGDVITVDEVGYYIVKDRNGTLNPEENAAYSRFLLDVVGDVTVKAKAEVPSGTKEVFYQGKDAYLNGGTYVPNDNLADANYATIGDHVAYQITSSVPNYTGYKYYYFIMNDTMSPGLTFDVNSVSVKIVPEGGAPIVPVKGEDYFVYTGEDAGEYTFRLAFKNIMEQDDDENQKYPIGAQVIVNYSALVNEDAIIGVVGNENAWSLDYSRNPYSTGNGEKNPKPGLPLESEENVLGQTPVEKTYTFLTELDITKYAVDDSEMERHLLAGAEFTLTGTSNQVVLTKGTHYVEYDATNADHANKTLYYKLISGSYTDISPKEATAKKWIKIGVGDADTTTGFIKNAQGEYVVPDNVTDYIGQDIYKEVTGKAAYANPDVSYVQEEVDKISLVSTPVSMKLTTDETGKVAFVGLGEGSYTLSETRTPDGYNTIDDISFTIEFTAPAKEQTTCTWEIVGWKNQYNEEVKGKPVASNGIFSTAIENMRGSLLPSTGGIGTTIFYVVGGILVIGAGILLVVKKRMSKN